MKKYILKFKGLFSITCFFQLVISAIGVGCAFVLQYMVDLATGGDMNKFIKGIFFFVAYCALSFIIDLLLVIFKTVYTKKTMIYIKQDIFSKLMKKDMKSFNEENSAKYLSILSNDITIIENDGIETIFSLIHNAFAFILALISVIYINIYITLAVFVLGTLAFVVPQLFSKQIGKRRLEYSTSLDHFTGKTKDILTGFELIKNFNIFDKISCIFSQDNENVEMKKQNFKMYSRVIECLSEFIGLLLYTAPVAIGGYFVLKGEITVGMMIALLQLVGRIIVPIGSSAQIINKLKSLKPIIEKIDNLTQEDTKKESKYSLESFEKSIEIKNLNFSYDGKKQALKDINQTFEKGKKYALVGGSGSGKSTILRLLLRYYEDFNGSILIDEKEHRDIDIDHIYKNISVIQQNVFMFDGTIKDNIGLYGDYTDDEILKAGKMAGLSKLLDTLTNGIYDDVGENGSKLSGGEKQRVAIARALIKKTSIMLLDESTSALDNETAYSIEKSILSLENVTSIVITHKLIEDVLRDYDEIIVMRDGAIVERGDFQFLIDEKGYFYSLYNVGQGNENIVNTVENEISQSTTFVVENETALSQ